MSDTTQSALAVQALSYRYGRSLVLDGLDLTIPSGALYALLGSNGAGKTTLLQLLVGARPLQHGEVRVFDTPLKALRMTQRQRITYVAEGQELPTWMCLGQMEAFLAPLYPSWDFALAQALRARFQLNPTQRIGAMSRGQRMKAALLVALAPKPRLLVMDEPFTGMDVAVKDELVRGLLDAAALEGATVLLCSHDIAEIEPLADWVGFLDRGRMRLSAPIDVLRAQYTWVELLTEASTALPVPLPSNWVSVERAGLRLSVLIKDNDGSRLPELLRDARRIDVREPSLKELYLALANRPLHAAEVLA